ncbi:integrase core domain-containing protein [Streptomyces sp. G-5]|uniref:integrase core domain-containing protein n=1 Tax=Streptomyces sp. G-5 TaxID=2977231 RepID=UPI0021CFB104|nr:integrase core domain-containing protein [Streptomyces sp. G-5]MCU4749919.1 integrase core domain-containing protein [Streptomyces sp. G-5]
MYRRPPGGPHVPPLAPTGRLRLARCVVEDGWPLRRAAERFQVSHTTAALWAGRYRQRGEAGMCDRSSRPHRQPARTPATVEEQVLRLRREHRIGPRWTRPWRPQSNGKVERFHRTLLDEWAYHQPCTTDTERREAFTDWIHWYNHHRPHTGTAGQTPASRVTNLPEQHT